MNYNSYALLMDVAQKSFNELCSQVYFITKNEIGCKLSSKQLGGRIDELSISPAAIDEESRLDKSLD
ncbi:hypothetical protein ACLKA6_017128 [Drosophila palustris]